MSFSRPTTKPPASVTKSTTPSTATVPKAPSPPSSPAPPPLLTVETLTEALKMHSLQITEMMSARFDKFDTKLDSKIDEFREEVCTVMQGMVDNAVYLDEKIEEVKEEVVENKAEVDTKLAEVDTKFVIMEDKLDDELTMLQFKEMEYAVRIRGLKEDPKEDLLKIFTEAVAPFVNMEAEQLNYDVDRIFRVNSRIAKQKNLPRDIVVYLTKRSLRNNIVQAYYRRQFKIADQDILLLKEVPPKILRSRKEYAFLSTELKNRQIQFRWDNPYGIIVTHQGTRYRLNTVDKAKKFYYQVLKGETETMMLSEEDLTRGQKEDSEQLVGATAGATADVTSEIQILVPHQSVPGQIPQDQRMTRAAHRRIEQIQKTEDQHKEIQKTEAVGGARPKQLAELGAKLQELRQPKRK